MLGFDSTELSVVFMIAIICVAMVLGIAGLVILAVRSLVNRWAARAAANAVYRWPGCRYEIRQGHGDRGEWLYPLAEPRRPPSRIAWRRHRRR